MTLLIATNVKQPAFEFDFQVRCPRLSLWTVFLFVFFLSERGDRRICNLAIVSSTCYSSTYRSFDTACSRYDVCRSN